MMKLIMLGAPGAGKGTQAQRLSERYAIPSISTGEIFRENLRRGTKLGKEAQVYMEAGELVPDDLTLQLLLDRIGQADCAGGYILDGFPRTLPQAQGLSEALAETGGIDAAVNVDVPDAVIVERMSGRRVCPSCGATYHIVSLPPKKAGICDRCGAALTQREDDKPETVKNRLAVYHEQTQPLIDYYGEKGLAVTVDGTKPVEAVFDDIVRKLGE